MIGEGILLLDKPAGCTSFKLVHILRKLTGIQKIGHAGTLDPFATGLMIMLIGKEFTKKSDQFLHLDKQYLTRIRLGQATNTYDIEGKVTQESDQVPTLAEVQSVLSQFQGEIEQIPPMFSAKKVKGKKLYELARAGHEIERKSQKVCVKIELDSYAYPYLDLNIHCSKGTYIRALGHDIGAQLGTFGHLEMLRRVRIGHHTLNAALSLDQLSIH
jgi:tRNA pseudouridine55 synthase